MAYCTKIPFTNFIIQALSKAVSIQFGLRCLHSLNFFRVIAVHNAKAYHTRGFPRKAHSKDSADNHERRSELLKMSATFRSARQWLEMIRPSIVPA
ncbi:hypothetical protein CEXT_575991 [Caerostris extrusa]|uniref:Uncharacterized protein n=1 Tax=Caerostris extrusa TaxID=172846 RepID=A0AAV4MV56_CAEEX|nr:hypothetical protein CEXT_575991 [Caerostris extrusa]